MRLLVAEDERDLNRLLQKVLTKAGYTVDGCYDGEEALLYLQGTAYDALVLDVMMPRKDGYTLVQEMRSQGMDTPVLFLTARDSVADRVKGMDLGADDYLVKPFDFDELLARLRAMTRKHVGQRTNTLTVGDLTLDTAQRRVTRGGEEIALLPKEFAILEYLMRHPGTVLSREQIEDQIWNYEYAGSSNNVDGYLSRLRKKIDEGRGEKLLCRHGVDRKSHLPVVGGIEGGGVLINPPFHVQSTHESRFGLGVLQGHVVVPVISHIHCGADEKDVHVFPRALGIVGPVGAVAVVHRDGVCGSLGGVLRSLPGALLGLPLTASQKGEEQCHSQAQGPSFFAQLFHACISFLFHSMVRIWVRSPLHSFSRLRKIFSGGQSHHFKSRR